ncbi:hypothetical protein MRBBS_0060 [Marinobacter sp. BSs20148]|nr:hypothetical protein MRBBS_0060 [Marinobacter sp. BSs20148]
MSGERLLSNISISIISIIDDEKANKQLKFNNVMIPALYRRDYSG